MSLFLISFVLAEQYTSTTFVSFNSGVSEENVSNLERATLLNYIFGSISLVLIIIAAVMIYRLRKKKMKKAKSAKKAVVKKKVKKKSSKKKK